MELLSQVSDLASLGPVYLAIGVFDGVHLGHRAVIGRAVEDARREPKAASVIVTFDPHPLKVLRPATAPRLLTSTAHKRRVFASLGATHCLTLPFNAEFSITPPEEFIGSLAHAGRPIREICVGFNWSFGRLRSGNLDLLNRLGERYGFAVVGLPSVSVNGETVSSTRIREAIERADFAAVRLMLGREFSILGTVIKGRQFGRRLGFPTANLAAHNEQFPPNGVWAVKSVLPDGEWHPGIVNLGYRPTVANPDAERLLELHLFNYDNDLYGQDVEITFHSFLRPEKRFESATELLAQIFLDVQEAKRRLDGVTDFEGVVIT